MGFGVRFSADDLFQAALLQETSTSSIRSRFPVFQKKIYLNSCSQGALSDQVEAGFQEYLRIWHEQGSPWDVWVQHYEAARTVFARLIGADTDEVALVASASAGVNGVASALSFRERNRVVMGEFDFPPWGTYGWGSVPGALMLLSSLHETTA